ncbi:MAG TPA: hypothetical protein ENL22_07075 [candidate division Zixibacteria bacterium]|nr:hypothetical protein [candidate division Zixibacteria bacterium]
MNIRCHRILIILALLVVIDLSFPRQAYAYLDPGTGTYLLQLLVAVLLGAAVGAKIFWQRIKSFFKNLFSR